MASNEDVDAIMSTDTISRLDAITRRHGGKPHRDEPIAGRIKLPPIKRGPIPQDPLFGDDA